MHRLEPIVTKLDEGIDFDVEEAGHRVVHIVDHYYVVANGMKLVDLQGLFRIKTLHEVADLELGRHSVGFVRVE